MLFGRWITIGRGVSSIRLARQINDFVGGSRALFWQRQGMYLGACLLTFFYYDETLAWTFLCLLQMTEILDMGVSSYTGRISESDSSKARRMHLALLLTSTLSALTVGAFTLAIVSMEEPGQHFTPLFFLFAAGLFAAVNNHQLPRVLLVRLLVYGAVFLYVPINDLMAVRPPLDSVLWMQLATVVFVLFFVIECALIFLKLYRKGLDNLQELRQERDRAHDALEVKSQFLATVSHELRTPLTSILGSLGVIQSGLLADKPDKLAEAIDLAHQNSRRLSDLINDLLDLQKIESGQMTYKFEPTEAGQLLTEAARMMQGYAEQSGVEIDVSGADQNQVVSADHGRLVQVLTNLLSNAVKFSDVGSKVVASVKCSDGKVRISVSDAGIGIPPNSRSLVFGKFSQIDGSDRRLHQGTGLGLNISQKIVRAHGGTIDYTSEVGKGTEFIVELDRLQHN
ncbi:MAG: HAMP domain-containing sensor histidine kinase [Rhodobacter sp.]|nr:HAMP domain-containing sensor histidine kinase [Rhodobacter sp.]